MEIARVARPIRRLASVCGAAALLSGVLLIAAGGSASAAPPRTLQVGCGQSSFPTIASAVTAATAGDTVVVCSGTYSEGVTIPRTKPLNLIGHHATIDATGVNNGIKVLASDSTVEGFTVENAIGEGILVEGAPGSPVTGDVVTHNTVMNNDQGNPTGLLLTTASYFECNAAGPVPGDCGEGVHLMVADNATVSHNDIVGNSGGVLLTDEFGPTFGNVIEFNDVSANLHDCGVTLAGHSPTGYVDGQTKPTTAGVYDNTVAYNTVTGNGILGQGGGVLMAAGIPGGGGAVYDNVVEHNVLEGNGLGGVTIHNHDGASQDLNGNVIADNLIKTNNLAPDKDFFPLWDPSTTGVIVANAQDGSTLTVTVTGNVFMKNAYGVWATPGVTFTGGLTSNVFAGNNGPALCTATPQIGTTPPGCS